jgi:hypothetical protein
VTYVSSITDDQLTIAQLSSAPGATAWPSLATGTAFPLSDTFCHRMLTGAPRHTSDAAAHEAYRSIPVREALGVTSYLGVPLRDGDGRAVGTLCAIDREGVAVGDRAQDAFALLAPAVAKAMFPEPAPITVQRTSSGWLVTGAPEGDEPAEDLTAAMVLADLISTELTGPGGRPPRADDAGDELARLRVSVAQLEHALTARVVVEQAIGVLAERRSVSPRAAFETLRGVARGSGRRVHALAADVVASAMGTTTNLAPSLARTASAPSPAAVANIVRARVPSNP